MQLPIVFPWGTLSTMEKGGQVIDQHAYSVAPPLPIHTLI